MIAQKQQQRPPRQQQHLASATRGGGGGGSGNHANKTQGAGANNILGGAGRGGTVKLSNVEAQRIVALLDETIAKLSALSLATRDALSEAQFFSEETREALEAHTNLEREYMRRLAESTAPGGGGGVGGGGNGGGDDDEALEAMAAAVYAGAREATRALAADDGAMRHLAMSYGTDGAVDSLAEAMVPGIRDPEEAEALSTFVTVLVKIREITFKRLLTTAEEERSRWEFVAEVMDRERVATANVRKLQQELASEKKAREKDVSLRHDVIERLKDELSELRMLNAERIKSSERQSREREASELQHFRTKENALSQQVRQLRTELAGALKSNRENEEALRKRKLRLERDVSEWIQKYDTDMEERHTELEELKDIMSREKRTLLEYEEHFHAQGVRREEIESQLSREREMKEHREKEWLRIFVAASKIQAMYRAFKIRKVFRERMRKKKKGKKKKKKAAV